MHDAERLEESRRLGPPVCSPLLGMVLSTAQALIPLFLCQQALRARSEFKYPDWNACSSRKRLFDYRRACPRSLAGTTGSDSRSGRSWLRRWKKAASSPKSKTFLGLRISCRRRTRSICEAASFMMDAAAWSRLPSLCLWSFCSVQVPPVSPSWTLGSAHSQTWHFDDHIILYSCQCHGLDLAKIHLYMYPVIQSRIRYLNHVSSSSNRIGEDGCDGEDGCKDLILALGKLEKLTTLSLRWVCS